LKVTVPVGELPPATVAVSLKLPPSGAVEDDNVVDTLGVDLTTVTTSDKHGLVAALLLASPL
jgi:hypothetical protein